MKYPTHWKNPKPGHRASVDGKFDRVVIRVSSDFVWYVCPDLLDGDCIEGMTLKGWYAYLTNAARDGRNPKVVRGSKIPVEVPAVGSVLDQVLRASGLS